MKQVDPHIDPEIEEAENTLVEILLNLYLQNQKEDEITTNSSSNYF